MQDITLGDKTAIVTGGGRGMGRTMAAALAAAGGRVVLASPEEDKLAEAEAEINAASGERRAASVVADVTRLDDCRRTVDRALEAFGAVHVLINNAGLAPQVDPATGNNKFRFWESDPDYWRRLIDTNVNGPYHMALAVAPHLIAQGWGRIVNVTTSLRTILRKENSPYGVSKGALEAATQIWAQDLAGTGVTVNSVIPGGAVDTDFASAMTRARVKLLPPEVIVPPVLWLASDLSDGHTGGRYSGIDWDATLDADAAAEKCREPCIFRDLPPDPRESALKRGDAGVTARAT